MASKITFHESYGDVSVAQLRAYKKFNVSPSDHNDLVEHFGESNHEGITAYVKDNAARNDGMLRIFDLYLGQ